MDILKKLYETTNPMIRASMAFTGNYMDFKDARECVFVIYEKRGYTSACEFIQMLSGYDLITLDNRTNLTTFVTMYEEEKQHKKKQQKMANKKRKELLHHIIHNEKSF